MNGGANLDRTNRQILRELRLNCRRSARELATVVGISPSSLLERIKKMEAAGIITGYGANVDFSRLGYEYQGIVQISISAGKILEVQARISELPGVVTVYDVTGTQDSLALVLCHSRAELSALLKKILSIPQVQKTSTSIILNVVKDINSFVDV